MPSNLASHEYDIALSFAGEDRSVAEAVASLLAEKNIRVFYDLYEEAALWGKDLYQHLCHIYRDRARFCLVFLSASYAQKSWTRHELKQAQARAISENAEYILPLRIDDTEIPGISSTMAYIDLRNRSISDVVTIVLKKLGQSSPISRSDANYHFNKFAADISASQPNQDEVKERLDALPMPPSNSVSIKSEGNISGIVNFGAMGNAKNIHIRRPEEPFDRSVSCEEQKRQGYSDNSGD